MESQKSLLTKICETIDRHRTERHMQQVAQPIKQPGRMSRLLRWFLPNGGTLILIALLIATQSV